jgi:molecular chaperone DnaK (HSP70)
VLVGLKHLVGRQAPKEVPAMWRDALKQTGITLSSSPSTPGIVICFGGATIRAEDAAIHFLSRVAALIEEQSGVAPTRLCVTVPVAFPTPVLNAYRTMLRRVFPTVREAQLTREPFAALLSHADSTDSELESQQFLVVDIGHGTLDVALMEMKASTKKKSGGRVLNLKVRSSMGADDCAGMSHTLALQVSTPLMLA